MPLVLKLKVLQEGVKLYILYLHIVLSKDKESLLYIHLLKTFGKFGNILIGIYWLHLLILFQIES